MRVCSFYQHVSGKPHWDWGISWGHAVSPDGGARWRRLPDALAPSAPAARAATPTAASPADELNRVAAAADSSGCWSGCTVRDQHGRMHALYTGVRLKPPPTAAHTPSNGDALDAQPHAGDAAPHGAPAGSSNGSAQPSAGEGSNTSGGPFASAERMAAMFSHLTVSQDLDDYAPHEPMKEAVMLASAVPAPGDADAAGGGLGSTNGRAVAQDGVREAPQGVERASPGSRAGAFGALQHWSRGQVVIAGPPDLGVRHTTHVHSACVALRAGPPGLRERHTHRRAPVRASRCSAFSRCLAVSCARRARACVLAERCSSASQMRKIATGSSHRCNMPL